MLGFQEVVEQVAAGPLPVAGARGQHAVGPRGDVRVGIDLPVRMRERHPDLGAPVLEAVDLLDAGEAGQPGGAVHPGRHDDRGLVRGQVGERGVVPRAEADDLAPAAGRTAGQEAVAVAGVARVPGGVACVPGSERGKAVLEDRDRVVGGRDLGAAFGRRGAQRAVAGVGLEGPVLAVAGDDHPLAEQLVAAGLRLDVERAEGAAVWIVSRAFGDGAEVHQLASVGQGDRDLPDAPERARCHGPMLAESWPATP